MKKQRGTHFKTLQFVGNIYILTIILSILHHLLSFNHYLLLVWSMMMLWILLKSVFISSEDNCHKSKCRCMLLIENYPQIDNTHINKYNYITCLLSIGHCVVEMTMNFDCDYYMAEWPRGVAGRWQYYTRTNPVCASEEIALIEL